MTAEMEAPQLAATRGDTNPISPAIVGGCVRILDIIIVGVVGVCVYLLYVYFRQVNVNVQYFPSILVGTVISAILFQLLSVYSGDFVFSKWLRIDRALLSWAVTFAVIANNLITRIYRLRRESRIFHIRRLREKPHPPLTAPRCAPASP